MKAVTNASAVKGGLGRLSGRVVAALLVLVLCFSALPAAVYATEAPPPEPETTTTTAAPATIKLNNLYLLGSNNKFYLCSPSLADGTDKYSFNIPNWMESVTIVIKAASGLTVSSEKVVFTESSGVYNGPVTGLTEKTQSYAVDIANKEVKRTLNITINRSKIPCNLESVTLLKKDVALTGTGSVSEGYSFTLESGTLSGIKLRLVPRHEDKVYLYNLTGMTEEEAANPTEDKRVTLELSGSYKRYDYELPLVEGTNAFRIMITAGDVTVTSPLTVIVGDPNANAVTLPTEETTAATSPTDAAPLTTNTLPDNAGSGFGMKPIFWVLIGVIAAVMIGAIIFLIINATSKNDDDDYDDYYDSYPQQTSRRRNLAEYVDDDDYYGARPQGRGREYDGYYDDGYSANSHRSVRYDDGDDYDYRPSRRSGRGDYDDYGY